MNERRIDLRANEEILFERESAVLTSRRLLANWKSDREPADEVLLSEITKVKTINGGTERRTKLGLQLIAGGVISMVAQPLLSKLGDKFELLVFSLGALALIVGIYLAIASLLQPRPYTLVLFEINRERDIGVKFPEWDSPDADELTLKYARARRRL